MHAFSGGTDRQLLSGKFGLGSARRDRREAVYRENSLPFHAR
jgi:hypothetical protein